MKKTLLGAMLALGVQSVLACGYCVEDKIAATYDHAVIMKAVAQKHRVAFLHVEGNAERAQLEQAAYAAGADRGSVRVSADRLTVSFAFDPARTPLGPLHTRMEKRLKLELQPFHVMERPEDLKTVRR
jgi:hypothetical protein